MSDEEFLARWFRRKREARLAVDKAAVDAPPPGESAETAGPAPVAAETAAAEQVDISSLPAVDSITAATDIAAFLGKGIPPELRRAALRRAWTADPAIRDFVGLAENAWDFNDPNAMPGFGPLDCSEEQLRAIVDRIVGNVRQAADGLATAPAEQETAHQLVDSRHQPASQASPEATFEATFKGRTPEEISTDETHQAPVAVQPDSSQSDGSDQDLLRRRTHGSALPR
jgi:hypothetical protein